MALGKAVESAIHFNKRPADDSGFDAVAFGDHVHEGLILRANFLVNKWLDFAANERKERNR
jgi:hypothetical protein